LILGWGAGLLHHIWRIADALERMTGEKKDDK
jgi:hypothetical protein